MWYRPINWPIISFHKFQISRSKSSGISGLKNIGNSGNRNSGIAITRHTLADLTVLPYFSHAQLLGLMVNSRAEINTGPSFWHLRDMASLKPPLIHQCFIHFLWDVCPCHLSSCNQQKKIPVTVQDRPCTLPDSRLLILSTCRLIDSIERSVMLQS